MIACKCVLANACCPFHKLWNSGDWKFTFQMNLLFQIKTRQLTRPCGYSSVVSSTSWYVLLRYALCGKTVLERFQFRYFSRPSSHHQAYVAVARARWLGWPFRFSGGSVKPPCPANAIFPQRELIQTLLRESERCPVSVIQYSSRESRRRRDILTT